MAPYEAETVKMHLKEDLWSFIMTLSFDSIFEILP